MKTTIGHLILLSLFIAGCEATYEEKELFLSSQKDTWFQDGSANWNWNGEEITGESSSGSSFLMTTESFKNFELSLEFFPDSTVNSGVFIRCLNNQISAIDCYEFNIWDLHPNQSNRSGALVGRAEPLGYVETLNQWNTYVIKAQNGKLEAWINDIKTVELKDGNLVEGYIAIQAGETGTIRFRNLKIKYPSN